jgi:hypothetical protein
MRLHAYEEDAAVFGVFKTSASLFRRIAQGEPSGADLAREFLDRAGTETRTSPLPAWALLLRSPFKAPENITSWLGGVPRAADGFKWPLDRDGTPLSFIAQIDLADVKPEPESGVRPPGLPQSGALLFFVGRSYACRILSEDELARSKPLILPERLPSLRKHGFFNDEQTFAFWPVELVAYLDRGSERPDCFPDMFEKPSDWITNWGIAAFEADLAIDCLNLELKEAEWFHDFGRRQDAAGTPRQDTPVIRSKTLHYTQMAEKAPALVAALIDWRDRALSHVQDDIIDKASLDEIFARRTALSNEMVENYWPKLILPGNARKTWEKINALHPGLTRPEAFQAIPSAYRPFVTAHVTGWRGHRLFGIEPPFPNNGEDLRGQDCLISIAADALLDTCSEHEYGMSIWCSQLYKRPIYPPLRGVAGGPPASD